MLSADVYSAGKVIITNNDIKVVTYSKPYKCGARDVEIKQNPNQENFTKEDKNLHRAQNTIKDIINANILKHSKFLTLTTADTVLDKTVFKRRLTSFFQAMKRNGYPLRYLGVLEHQKERGEKEGNEGSWHCHLVIFNDEYIPFEIINKYWKGRTDIHILNGLIVVDGQINGEKVNSVADYVCKYITKDNFTEFRSQCYFCSNHLARPAEFMLPCYKMNDDTFTTDKNDPEYIALNEILPNYEMNNKTVIKSLLPFDKTNTQTKIIKRGVLKNE